MAKQERTQIQPLDMDVLYSMFLSPSLSQAGRTIGMSASSIGERSTRMKKNFQEVETLGLFLLLQENNLLDPVKLLDLRQEDVDKAMQTIRSKRELYDVLSEILTARSLYPSTVSSEDRRAMDIYKSRIEEIFGANNANQAVLLFASQLTSDEQRRFGISLSPSRRLSFQGKYTYPYPKPERGNRYFSITQTPEETKVLRESVQDEKPIAFSGNENPVEAMNMFVRSPQGCIVMHVDKKRAIGTTRYTYVNPRLVVTVNKPEALHDWLQQHNPRLLADQDELEMGEMVTDDGYVFIEPHTLIHGSIANMFEQVLSSLVYTDALRQQVRDVVYEDRFILSE